MRRVLLLASLLCALAACTKSPTTPSSAEPSRVLLGQTVSALDGTAAPNVAVQIGNRWSVTTDRDGMFAVEVGTPGPHDATFRGSAIVDRRTTVLGPTTDRARLSLIPAGFDLAAFDEMFRTSNDRLQRWTSRPSLVVLATVMTYRQGGGNEYDATAEQLTDDEVAQMTAHLTEGLSLLTGDAHRSFESVVVERPPAGARVGVAREGRIVVGRYTGIVSLANTIGYGQWSERADGTITGGAMYLDRDFDRQDPRRRLLRIHELGHALGYLHVRTRASIMNPAVGTEPTEFDRTASRIAFQRPPGNRSPDIDPPLANAALALSGGGGRWMPPVFCR